MTIDAFNDKMDSMIEYMRSQLTEHDSKIKNLQSKNKKLLTGSWCATQSLFTHVNNTINYDRIFHEDSNMNENALNSNTLNNNPLNAETGETL